MLWAELLWVWKRGLAWLSLPKHHAVMQNCLGQRLGLYNISKHIRYCTYLRYCVRNHMCRYASCSMHMWRHRKQFLVPKAPQHSLGRPSVRESWAINTQACPKHLPDESQNMPTKHSDTNHRNIHIYIYIYIYIHVALVPEVCRLWYKKELNLT